MILSTTPQIEGHTIREYKGVVSTSEHAKINIRSIHLRHSLMLP